MGSTEDLFNQLQQNIIDYDKEATLKTAHAIIAADLDVMAAIQVASAAITDIGDQFQRGEVFLPQLMLAGDTMQACMKVLSAHLSETGEGGRQSKGKVVIGAVFGDMHDIGKNLVASMLSVHGFEIVDLGVNVNPKTFFDTAENEGADFIAMSSLMTTSMPYQKDVVKLLSEAGSREKYFVVVGGGPVTPDYAKEIGTDGWGLSAVSAVRVCEELLETGRKPASGEPIIKE